MSYLEVEFSTAGETVVFSREGYEAHRHFGVPILHGYKELFSLFKGTAVIVCSV
jgi:hypothetical protein